MITLAQSSRLISIAEEIGKAPTHPSPSVRVSVGMFSDQELKAAQEFMDRIINDEDGHLAFKVIQSWHRGGIKEVINYLKDNRLL